MSVFDIDTLASRMGNMRIGTLVQKPIDIDDAKSCMVRIDKETKRDQAVDCVIHSLAATGFLTIKEASEIAPTINSTRKGILIEKTKMYLGDKLHKKIDIREYTIDNTNIQSSLQDIKEYLFQNLAIDNATPISYTRFRMTTDENGNKIKEPFMGHNVVVMNTSSYGGNVIIIDTQQNKMNEFNSYFIKDEPNVYKVYLYFQSDLPETAMEVVADSNKFTTDGGKRNKKSNKKSSRKSNRKTNRKTNRKNKTKRRKMKRKN